MSNSLTRKVFLGLVVILAFALGAGMVTESIAYATQEKTQDIDCSIKNHEGLLELLCYAITELQEQIEGIIPKN